MYRVSFHGVEPNYLRNFHDFTQGDLHQPYRPKDIIPMSTETKKIDYLIKGLKVYRVSDKLLVHRYRTSKLLDAFIKRLNDINKSLFGRKLVIKRVY